MTTIQNITIIEKLENGKQVHRTFTERSTAFSVWNRKENPYRFGCEAKTIEAWMYRDGIMMAHYERGIDLAPAEMFSQVNTKLNYTVEPEPVDFAPAEMFTPSTEIDCIYPEHYSPTDSIHTTKWTNSDDLCREYYFYSRDSHGFFLLRALIKPEDVVKQMNYRLRNSFDSGDYNTRNHVSSFLKAKAEAV